jgi:D-alanine-D-alanine ligase-like ATP-grasp enzyme
VDFYDPVNDFDSPKHAICNKSRQAVLHRKLTPVKTMSLDPQLITLPHLSLLTTGKFQFLNGYWGSMRQPVMCVHIQLAHLEMPVDVVRQIDSWRNLVFKKPSSTDLLNTYLFNQPVLRLLALLALDVLTTMKMPVMSGARAVFVKANEPYWLLGLPAVAKNISAPQAAFEWASTILHASLKDQLPSIPEAESQLKVLVDRFQRLAPAGVNTLRFLQAAHNHQIPWRRVAGNVYQFGWGRPARWLDSTFTDQTPAIAAFISQNKQATAEALRAAGIPVPPHYSVKNPEQAIQAAQLLGYPVVVKPADKDGGQGVFACLQTPKTVSRAYVDAAKFSVNVLVEKFVPGNDYRLQVYQGKVFWAIHRRPARVTGDGVHSVAELIKDINVLRNKFGPIPDFDPMAERGLTNIVQDDEFHEWLLAQNSSLDSIPTAGESIRLRGAANVGMGGTLMGVPLHIIHPDNLSLAIKAAAVLRLDLAGIDLLLPDISRSWRDTGGAICEVNGKPQLSGHLHTELLPQMVPRQGRIPIVVLSISEDLWCEQDQVLHNLAKQGIKVAWAKNILSCHQALADPDVDALVWQLDKIPSRYAPLPMDIFDLFIECSVSKSNFQQGSEAEQWPNIYQRARAIWNINSKELTQSLESYLLNKFK